MFVFNNGEYGWLNIFGGKFYVIFNNPVFMEGSVTALAVIL